MKIFNNISKKAHHKIIFKLVIEDELINIIISALESINFKILKENLSIIKNILSIGEIHYKNNGENMFLIIFESKGGIQKLEYLQNHENEEIYQETLSILEKYYEFEEPLK